MPKSRPAQPKVLLPTLISCLWPWFLVWSALALVVLPMKLDEAEVAKWTNHRELGQVLRWLVGYFDVIWYLLALLNVYLFTVSREGLTTARRWGMTVIPAVLVALWVGLRTGVPFGEFYYTGKLGWRMAGTPPVMAVLLWFTLIVGCRYAMQAIAPRAERLVQAAGGAGLLLVSAALLEQVAWKVRFYWLWPSESLPVPIWPPVQNFVAWYVLGFALLWLIQGKPPVAGERFSRPIIVLLVLNAVFLVARLVNL